MTLSLEQSSSMTSKRNNHLPKKRIADFIYAAKCDDCKKGNEGQCRIETEQLDNCPVDLIEWLRKQAN